MYHLKEVKHVKIIIMTKKDWNILKKYDITPDNLTVGGWLDLRGTGITTLPDNLTVVGSLYLIGTGITTLPDNLTVVGSLYLSGTGITTLPDNLTVGGSLDLSGTGITDTSKVKKDTSFLSWRKGKYILVDGEFTEVLSNRGSVWKVKYIGKNDPFFLVTDGKGKYAHGASIKDAKESLIYKIIDRDKSEFKHLTLDTTIDFSTAIEAYRAITGACAYGIKNFVESKGVKKESYTVSEIIEITNGSYGSDIFKAFILSNK